MSELLSNSPEIIVTFGTLSGSTYLGHIDIRKKDGTNYPGWPKVITDARDLYSARIADINDPHEQLAGWANIKVKEIEQIPMRKVAAAINIIAKEFMGPSAINFTPKKA